MTLTSAQAEALAHIRRAYIGPEHGDEEVLVNRPSLQYTVGMLFPREESDAATGSPAARTSDTQQFVIADVEEGDVEEDSAAPPLAEDWRPSSTALSFVTDSETFLCDFSAATYAPIVDEGPLRWGRSGHEFKGIQLVRGSAPHSLINAGGLSVEIGSRWREYGSAWLVTVHVRLLEKSTGDDREDISRMLFQVELGARPFGDAKILEYDVSSAIEADQESRELRFRYRNTKVYGVGHGMAAGWELDQAENCTRLFLDPVPHYVVPAVEQALGDEVELSAHASESLRLAFLETIDSNPDTVTSALREFTQAFSTWADGQVATAEPLGESAAQIAERSRVAAERMRAGVELLVDPANNQLRVAFALGMAAMRLQMRQAAVGRGTADAEPSWRPFQLGFVLIGLASSTDEAHADRELVDLIWFPTGGGKTEAYLALAAIVIYLRRLVHGQAGAGTAVITRYTLRLLTSQQFQRAASLICAMEILRVTDERSSGMAKFSIGLWVGNDVTPRDRAGARHSLKRLLKASQPRDANEFQVMECPWCLTALVPERRDDTGRAYGPRLVGNDVVFLCVNSMCEFSQRELPMVVVDEALYEDPPTFLLATVDKFARLQFNEHAGKLLGIGTAYRQPELMIQDELHLLSGPLGTTVAVFDAVIQLLLGRAGHQPKIVASTATIRAAADQVSGLYGREVALYPPAGLDGDTTFFARPVKSGQGRLYVGLMPQSTAQATALVAVTAPLLEIPTQLLAAGIGRTLDPYWTLVMYHNSLRELGRTGALLLDDINGRLETRAERLGLNLRNIRAASVLELTSRRGPEELPSDLRQLGVSADASSNATDVVLSSNMLSVGIDVQRLALMLMVGQPKTTAEYIQATSRVGRGEVNGVVVTLYRSNRARDRSHFETFRSYHLALYRSVEPTSVTPWSLSSRDRSLAGALVALLRSSFPALASDASAGHFDLTDNVFRKGLDSLVERFLDLVSRADESERADVAEKVWEILREWDHAAQTARDDGVALTYERRTGTDTGLLKRFGQMGPGWLVADSMRSVEPNVAIEVQEPLREAQRANDQT